MLEQLEHTHLPKMASLHIQTCTALTKKISALKTWLISRLCTAACTFTPCKETYESYYHKQKETGSSGYSYMQPPTNMHEPPTAGASVKKKANAAGSNHTVQSVDSVSTLSLTLSPANSLESPAAVDMGATPSSVYAVVPYGGSHSHLASVNAPQPPPYDECIETAASMQAIHVSNMEGANNYGFVHYDYHRGQMMLQQQQQLHHHHPAHQQNTIHPRQTSLPASTAGPAMNGSLRQQAMSYNTLAVNTAYQATMPPPKFALSPPASYAGSLPQQVSNGIASPNKTGSRPSLPTSPTYIAALLAAQQRNGFEYPDPMGGYRNANTAIPQYYGQQYPTPPHSHGMDSPEAYLTPSPESPGQWSSALPHSTSDWSEGISSSPNPSMTFTGSSHSKHTEGVYI